MAAPLPDRLLGPEDPAPIGLFNAAGPSPFLLIGDHAGSALPRSLQGLGLAPADRARHIALDIGVFGLGHALARLLDAAFIHQTYSRLVIDCNRAPTRPDAIPDVSDHTPIPGNQRLDKAARTQRIDGIHAPYHAAIAAILGERRATRRRTVLLSLHSFTPVMDGIARPWHVGILHANPPANFARAMLASLGRQSGIVAGDNVPYAMDDTDFTVPHHAFAARLPYAEIEVRQDLLADAAMQQAWAERLASAAQEADADRSRA